MNPYWIKFETGPSGCVEAANEEEALKLASQITGRKAVKAETLPYPATPRLNPSPDSMPSFCWDPENCKGRRSCPKHISCIE